MRKDGQSEDAFLGDEARLAQAAILRTIEDLKHDLAYAADLKYWTENHPWAALGIASAAGFLAAAAIVPSHSGHAHPASPEPIRAAEPAPRPAGSNLAWLMVPLVDLVKTSVERYIASVTQAAHSPDNMAEAQAAAQRQQAVS
jgi:hypothetical protein